ncbi:hypothetical protein ABT081_02510 [Streptomyces sp. NPDC002238]|uniref:hypothetical protein n=1 Tax=Streptomyces sp. NPDC002238 TaxID=3156649 RepID=UPI003327DEA8
MTIDYGEGEPSAVYLAGADGEWVEIGHVAEGGLVLGTPNAEDEPAFPSEAAYTVTTEDVQALQAAILAVAEAYRRAYLQIVPELITTFRGVLAAVESARDLDEYALAPPRPGRRRDRPAWQSPYGPPARRRP